MKTLLMVIVNFIIASILLTAGLIFYQENMPWFAAPAFVMAYMFAKIFWEWVKEL